MIVYFLPNRLKTKLCKSELHHKLVNLCSWTLLMFAGYTLGFQILEKSSWGEALWQAWQTATTVGYGNAPAESDGGRWVSVIFGSMLIAMVGAMIALAFDLRSWTREQRKLGMTKNPYTDGYVVFHYPGESTLSTLIQELRSVEPEVPVCVVDHALEQIPESLHSTFNQLHFVRGSMLEKETYERANLRDSKAVIVFPEDPSSSMSDAQTRTVLDIVLGYVDDSTRLLYFLQDINNFWLFKHLDKRRATPVLQNLEVLAAVQECQDQHSAIITQRLLRNTEGEYPRTVMPKELVGKTWSQFCRGLLAWSEQSGRSATPLALIQGEAPDSCPAPGTTIAANDAISIIACEPFDWAEVDKAAAELSS